ncbi:MAG: HtaA domain-containing protein [Brevundimonas sp.]
MNTRTGRAARAVAGAGALALVATAAVIALPASAADAKTVTASSGDLAWGFRQAFRSYVGGAGNPLPAAERITVGAPATFDAAGTAAVAGNDASKPYLFPVTGGSVTSADDVRIETSGSVVYHYPAHTFTATVKDVTVVVADGVGTLVGDLSVALTTGGTSGGDDVVLGTIIGVDVDVDADSVSVTGTGVKLSAAGATALQGFLAAGSDLDGFSVSAALDAPAQVWNPSITVSKTSGFDRAGTESVTITGTGFDPDVNKSTRPPVTPGASTGVYVTFGRFADVWRPSAGAASSTRPVTSQKWALPQASLTQVAADYPTQAPSLVELKADGSFTATLDVKAATATSGNYGIYVYAAGGASANAGQEIFVPISFVGDVSVGVDVPKAPDPEPEPGVFAWTIQGSGAVSLGTAAAGAQGFTATGELPTIVVKDTRDNAPAFSLAGQAGNFRSADGAHTFGGQALGWTPKVTNNGAGALAGSAVSAGSTATSGLRSTSTLVSAATGHAKGEVTVGAKLDLVAPADVAPGSYTATLTLTALS